MKVAICFWGLCRSTDRTIESIKRCIFDPLKNAGISYDVYLHTYKLFRPYTNIRSNEMNIQLNNTNWKLLDPKTYTIDDQDEIDKTLRFESYRTKGDPWRNEPSSKIYIPYNTLDNHIRSLMSLNKVTKLWIDSNITYDKILYLRPDVRFQTPLNIDWIKASLPNTVLIPNFHLLYGTNDRFAIGEPETMKHYGLRFKEAYEYSKQKKLHSEQFLSDLMWSKGCQFKTIPFRFLRVRANGIVESIF